jgi:hypothetical protein
MPTADGGVIDGQASAPSSLRPSRLISIGEIDDAPSDQASPWC